MVIDTLISKRSRAVIHSALGDILAVASQPSIISLAGGLPAPESFPLSIIDSIHAVITKKYKGQIYQYSSAQGIVGLREEIAIWMKQRKIQTTANNIGISTGSQGALDCIGKLFIENRNFVAVESPTYLGALDAFAAYGPRYKEIETDEYGAIPESLEKILKNNKIKLIYLVPTFQNPTGKTIPKHRRIKIARIIKKYDCLLIEDDPYCSIRYEGVPIDPIQTMIPDNTIYLSTFSKILAPGIRIGFYIAQPGIVKLLTAVKSSVDLHTNSYGQYLAEEYLRGKHLSLHLPTIIKIYSSRRKTMLEALKHYFPKDYSWQAPDGGMFVWVEGPKNTDMKEVYWKAIENGVAFVPGQYFYIDPKKGKNTMRLNFTNVTETQIKKAIKILASILPN